MDPIPNTILKNKIKPLETKQNQSINQSIDSVFGINSL